MTRSLIRIRTMFIRNCNYPVTTPVGLVALKIAILSALPSRGKACIHRPFRPARGELVRKRETCGSFFTQIWRLGNIRPCRSGLPHGEWSRSRFLHGVLCQYADAFNQDAGWPRTSIRSLRKAVATLPSVAIQT